METATEPSAPTLPSIFEAVLRVTTTTRPAARRRRIGLWAGLVAISAGAGIAVVFGSRRRGLVAGGVAALALGALRVQLARWFTETPSYEVEAQVGELELRRYPTQIEARAQVQTLNLDAAIDRGYGRLACYVYGANAEAEDLIRTTPVITTMRDGSYSTAFVMPPEREIASLPEPDDSRVVLHEVPDRRIAALAFRGPFTRENVATHERALLQQVVAAGLAARGSVSFACYDSPATLPFLRRNELWIEIV